MAGISSRRGEGLPGYGAILFVRAVVQHFAGLDFIPVILRGKLEDLPEDLRKECHSLNYKAQATKPELNIGDDEETTATPPRPPSAPP